MSAGNRNDNGWKRELSPTAECVPIERLSEDLTPQEHDHLAHCARCQAEMALWKEMQQEEERTPGETSAVQAIVGDLRGRLAPLPSNVVAMPPRRQQRRAFRPAALATAAAVVVAVGIGLFVQNHEPSIEGPAGNVNSYRSAGVEVIAPTGEFAAPPKTLHWKPVGSATMYEVQVLEVDQTVLWRASTQESQIGIPAAVVEQFVPGKTVLWQVKARRGQAVIADSGQQRFRVSVKH